MSRENQATVQKTLQESIRGNIPLITFDTTSWNLDDLLGMRITFPRYYKSIRKNILKSPFSQAYLVLKQNLFVFLYFYSPFWFCAKEHKHSLLWDLYFLSTPCQYILPCGLNRWHQQCSWEAEWTEEEGSCSSSLSFWVERFQCLQLVYQNSKKKAWIYKGNFNCVERAVCTVEAVIGSFLSLEWHSHGHCRKHPVNPRGHWVLV